MSPKINLRKVDKNLLPLNKLDQWLFILHTETSIAVYFEFHLLFIDEEESSTGAVNDLALQLKEEKKAFIKRKKETSILKRGGSRESEVAENFPAF